MHRVTLWIVSTISAVVVLFSYHTSANSGTASAALAPATPGGSTTSTATVKSAPTAKDNGSTNASPSGSARPSSGATETSSTGTYVGGAVDTRWGPVQVQITVQNGKVTDVRAIVYPQGNARDQEINAYALPVLHDEVIKAQSASIDTVGGATVTSDGYISSLQSALDAAHVGA